MADGRERSSLAKMFAEGLREVGILYLVFGILDAQIEARRRPHEPIDFAWFGLVLIVSGVIWLMGAGMERRRRE